MPKEKQPNPPIEEWKRIVLDEEETAYEISNQGRIKSFKRYKEGKIVKLNMTSKYPRFRLYHNGKMFKNAYVHLLVAEYFLEPVEGKYYVTHKNKIKTDNRAENLEYTDKVSIYNSW